MKRTDYVRFYVTVIEPTNEMKAVMASLREEENRIFFEMIQCIGIDDDNIAIDDLDFEYMMMII